MNIYSHVPMPDYHLKNFLNLLTPVLLLTPSVLPQLWLHVLARLGCTLEPPSRPHLIQSHRIHKFVEFANGVSELGQLDSSIEVFIANATRISRDFAWFVADIGRNDGDMSEK